MGVRSKISHRNAPVFQQPKCSDFLHESNPTKDPSLLCELSFVGFDEDDDKRLVFTFTVIIEDQLIYDIRGIIVTSAEVTLNCGLVKESSQNPGLGITYSNLPR